MYRIPSWGLLEETARVKEELENDYTNVSFRAAFQHKWMMTFHSKTIESFIHPREYGTQIIV